MTPVMTPGCVMKLPEQSIPCRCPNCTPRPQSRAPGTQVVRPSPKSCTHHPSRVPVTQVVHPPPKSCTRHPSHAPVTQAEFRCCRFENRFYVLLLISAEIDVNNDVISKGPIKSGLSVRLFVIKRIFSPSERGHGTKMSIECSSILALLSYFVSL